GLHERKLVILEQEQDEAVWELDPARLRNRERAQGRFGDVLPRPRHFLSAGGGAEQESEDRGGGLPHGFFSRACTPPPRAGDSVSMRPTGRLAGVKVATATRRMSAFVTRSIRSTWRKSSRQSPKSA